MQPLGTYSAHALHNEHRELSHLLCVPLPGPGNQHLFGSRLSLTLDELGTPPQGPNVLARIIHERSIGLPLAYRKSAKYAGKVADSLHFQLDTLKTEFPLYINNTRLRE